jgi:carbon-monoxide dehydrogenase large subunit
LRRRNLLRKDAFPLKTPTGSSYDSADPARLLDTALQAADWTGFKARRKAARKNGKLRGLGLALFLEPSGGMGKEQVEIRVGSDGRLALYSLAGPSGQGTKPCFRPWSRMCWACRRTGSSCATTKSRTEARRRRHLRFTVADLPRRCASGRGQGDRREGQEARGRRARGRAGRHQLRQRAVPRHRDRPVHQHEGADRKAVGSGAHPLDTNLMFDIAFAYPSGAHIAEVEIDPETGRRKSSTTSRPTIAAISSITSWWKASCMAD